MAIAPPLNLKKWIEENRGLFEPPIGNRCVFETEDDFIVMVVGGPNARRDFHLNQGQEFLYQVVGDIVLKVIDNGKHVDIPVREGEIFLIPPRVPHSPQRPAGSVGLVIERVRSDEEMDGFVWYCEACGNKLYDEYFHVDDIVAQLPPVMQRFEESEQRRTCHKCGTVMAPPTGPKLDG